MDDKFIILPINPYKESLKYDFPSLWFKSYDKQKIRGYFNKPAYKYLNGGGQVSFAQMGNSVFICFLPKLSEVRGYKLISANSCFTANKLINSFNLAIGVYKIETEDVINKYNLDWFELTLIE